MTRPAITTENCWLLYQSGQRRLYLLMNACGGEAARVLREYAYFSPELKAILEKAALIAGGPEPDGRNVPCAEKLPVGRGAEL